MSPIPNPVRAIRQAIHIITVAGHSGRRILKLALPIVSVVITTIEEIRKSKIHRLR